MRRMMKRCAYRVGALTVGLAVCSGVLCLLYVLLHRVNLARRELHAYLTYSDLPNYPDVQRMLASFQHHPSHSPHHHQRFLPLHSLRNLTAKTIANAAADDDDNDEYELVPLKKRFFRAHFDEEDDDEVDEMLNSVNLFSAFLLNTSAKFQNNPLSNTDNASIAAPLIRIVSLTSRHFAENMQERHRQQQKGVYESVSAAPLHIFCLISTYNSTWILRAMLTPVKLEFSQQFELAFIDCPLDASLTRSPTRIALFHASQTLPETIRRGPLLRAIQQRRHMWMQLEEKEEQQQHNPHTHTQLRHNNKHADKDLRSTTRRTPFPHFEFFVCYPPLHGGYDNTAQIVESVALNRVFSNYSVHFYFYNYSAGHNVDTLIRKLARQGLATIVQWPLDEIGLGARQRAGVPTNMNGGVTGRGLLWYFGQVAANNDCLYRVKKRSPSNYSVFKQKKIVFTDFDEILVPRIRQTWQEMLSNDLFQLNGISTFSFNRALFRSETRIKNGSLLQRWLSGGRASTTLSHITSLTHFSRLEDTSVYWPKMLVNAARVEAVGIHRILIRVEQSSPHSSSVFEPALFSKDYPSIVYVHEIIGLVHHYRMNERYFWGKVAPDLNLLRRQIDIIDEVERLSK